jgi:hypothetical protein
MSQEKRIQLRDRSLHEPAIITIDATMWMKKVNRPGQSAPLQVDLHTPVSTFLDRVFFWMSSLDPEFRAFSYGEYWLLENQRTLEIYDQIGIAYCRSKGKKRDTTPLFETGVKDGDVLTVIPLDVSGDTTVLSDEGA